MDVRAVSMTLVTSRLSEVRRFYEAYFGAAASFDCGWYVVLRLGQAADAPELCLMEPRDGSPEVGGGVTLNIRVADADLAHANLHDAGIAPVIPLDDHPWGDRGFGVTDPAGVVVYCYHPIAPSAEFSRFVIPPGQAATS